MVRIKFIGQTDINFTKGKTYTLVNLIGDCYYVYAFITNGNKEISCIPYDNIGRFNENWEVVND